MNGYRPTSAGVVAAEAALAAAGAILSLLLTRRPLPGRARRGAAWAAGAILVAGAERIAAGQPGGFRMLAICTVLFVSMKVIVGVETLARGGAVLPSSDWLGFALAWPGMDPALFERRRRAALDARPLILSGALALLAGLALIAVAAIAVRNGAFLLAVTPLLLIGASLVLHFGLFTIAAGLWRTAGVPAQPLFRAPLASASLAEFWGRRWNLAFTEMVRRTIYPAVREVAGPRSARMAGFLFSGFLHELAITVPVRSGYGGPLLYFAIQGGLVAVENRVLGEPGATPLWKGRVWTMSSLLLPLPLLIPAAFLRQVVWPLLGMCGAAS